MFTSLEYRNTRVRGHGTLTMVVCRCRACALVMPIRLLQLWTVARTAKNRACYPVNAIAAGLGKQLCENLLGFHAFAGFGKKIRQGEQGKSWSFFQRKQGVEEDSTLDALELHIRCSNFQADQAMIDVHVGSTTSTGG